MRPPIVGLLIDVSGNLHVGSKPTTDAVKAFRRLRQSSMPFRLCSNTSKESTACLVRRLEGMGFEISTKEVERDGSSQNPISSPKLVWTSIGAVAQVLKDMGLKEPFLLLSDSAREEVVQAIGKKELNTGIGEGSPQVSYDSVVVGLTPSLLDYPHLNTAFRILKGETSVEESVGTTSTGGGQPAGHNANGHIPQPHVPLIATHKAKYVQSESGLSLGPGPFVTALENATNIAAHVVGKPTRAFFELVIQDFTQEELAATLPPGNTNARHDIEGRIAVIGDDVEADLGEGAVELGLWRILVKTGKYRTGDESRPGVIPPDEVFESFFAFIDSLLSERGDKFS